jgi:hypothetical protein
VAALCDARYAELAAEPFGPDLVALHSPALDLRVHTPRPATPAGTPTAGMAAAASLESDGLCQLLWCARPSRPIPMLCLASKSRSRRRRLRAHAMRRALPPAVRRSPGMRTKRLAVEANRGSHVGLKAAGNQSLLGILGIEHETS